MSAAPVSRYLIENGGAETPRALTEEALQWLRSLSPDLAHDAQWMESVESWRVDRVPGPWMRLFRWLTQERQAQHLSDEELHAILDFLGYIGSVNALLVMARTVEPEEALERLLSLAMDRQGSGDESEDPVATVTLMRIRRLLVRRFFTRVFSPERRAAVLDIVLHKQGPDEEGWA